MTAFFDTHAHYDDKAFDEDRETLLEALPGKGIARVVNVGASLASCKRTVSLADRYDYIYAAVGIHPSETAELDCHSRTHWCRQDHHYQPADAFLRCG